MNEIPDSSKILIPVTVVDNILSPGTTFSDIGMSTPDEWTSGDGMVYFLFTPVQTVELLRKSSRILMIRKFEPPYYPGHDIHSGHRPVRIYENGTVEKVERKDLTSEELEKANYM